MDDYKFHSIIGQGTFGSVYEVDKIVNNESKKFAVKRFFKNIIPTRRDRLVNVSEEKLQESLLYARNNPPPYAELGPSWDNYISTLEGYLSNKQRNVSDAIMQENGIFFNPEKPLTKDDIDLLNQKNIELEF